MGSICLNLGWKELHELKWVTLSTLAAAAAIPAYCTVRDPQVATFWVQMMLVIYPFFGGICFGMRAAAGERARRTAPLLAAMPVRPPLLGLFKLLPTLIAVLIPVLLLTLLGLAMKRVEAPELAGRGNLYAAGIVSALCSIHITLLVAVFGAGRRTEVFAAGRAMLVIGLWAVAAMVAVSYFPAYRYVQIIRWIGPPFELFDGALTDPGWDVLERPAHLTLVAISIVALAIVFVVRYQRTLAPIGQGEWLAWKLGGWSPARLSSPLSALMWKQFREAVPLGGLVLGLAVIFSVVLGGTYEDTFGFLIVRAIGLFSVLVCMGGFVLAILIGVGTFAPDLEGPMNTFWRSRPISPSQWFWTKYLVGLGTLVVGLGVPALAAFMIVVATLGPLDFVHEIVNDSLWVLLGWFGMFSAAVAAACLVRHTLYAAILAVGLVAASFTLVSWWDAALFSGLPLESPAEDAAIWLMAAVGCIAVGWWSTVRDVALA